MKLTRDVLGLGEVGVWVGIEKVVSVGIFLVLKRDLTVESRG
jgi:hypothetical protein